MSFQLSRTWSGAAWLSAGLIGILLLGAWTELQIHRVESVHALNFFPLPSQVEFSATIVSIRASGAAKIMALQNNGTISCYWRKPPELLFLFPRDAVRVRAKLESTPQGRLCVIQEVIPLVVGVGA